MKIALWILAILLLAGCGARYEVIEDFVPPADRKARACIAGCEQQRQACEAACDHRFQACRERAEARAHTDLPARRRAYLDRLDIYLRERELWLDEQALQLRQRQLLEARIAQLEPRCTRDERSGCSELNRLRRERDALVLPDPPERPAEPTLESLVARYQADCRRDCDCDASFRACYIGCGGEVRSRRVCVANCDEQE
ncbi:hypothetical protein [endosymbiont of unidentified scaly snail isolate Monju]|uniref:hypothetical protein n=1 Tax=endosymbiont of unidentified scaly snail isolate Monju TaxID=1248727 RepID=UPI00038920C5|nr:hypothetical protein [endosymbiont of unidentified scaly snail isolate Monju]BAN69247.1 hypothetical protein EBS_1352 [endosymbiont of unidentified scaly snail isolate Monju]